jgi:hypothetical protein
MTKGRDHHADGQKDFSAGKYSQPHGILEEAITLNANARQAIIDNNREYDKGWRNAKNQGR